MEKLIPYLSEIYDILSKANIRNELQLPQIVVIGSQSVGKSSLIESIVGKEFLPRGKGIVTRRPLEIQLTQLSEDQDEEWFQIETRKDQRLQDTEDVVRAIEQETEKVAGKNKAVSSFPLKVKFFSKRVLDLILVDLPGLTKIPVGDQPQDIEQKILELVMPYVQNPNSLLLAISKAQDDLATSEGLKLARQVDPEGVRTLGVITQLDMMEQGTDALNDLLNKTYPLQLGYVGVVMRSAKDLQKKTLQQQLLDERAFFENHKVYRKHADQMGVKYLLMTLNLNLIKSIKKCLPQIRDSIVSLVQNKEYELQQFGEFQTLDTQEAKSFLILNLISKFSHAYKDMLDGRYLGQTSQKELNGGSRIIHVFNEVFRKTISSLNPFDIMSDDDIRTAIKNANGIRPSLFVPEGAFEILVRQQIKRLEAPSLECSHLVYEELRRVLNQINLPEIERFDNLSNSFFDVVESLLHKCVVQTDQMIRNLIDIELGYINTSHPDFVSGMDLAQKEEHHQQEYRVIHNQKSGNATDKVLTDFEGKNKSLLNFWPFQNPKQNKVFKKIKLKFQKQTELFDSKLEILGKKKKKQNIHQDDVESESQISSARSVIEDLYQGIVYNGRRHRERVLPQVPNNIRISDRPTKREQTETEMIKDLIVSYFNVVKKNINDTVPKTIITFLVSQSHGLCERELIGQLYKTETIQQLLAENQFYAKQRFETKKQLLILRNCLNLLNDLDSKF